MQTFSRCALLIGAALVAFAPCRAAALSLPVDPSLVSFVEQQTGQKLPEGLRVQVVDNDAPIFQNEAARHAGADAAEVGGVVYIPVRVAVHYQEEKTRALLVHELTHIAQEQRGGMICPAAAEWEANRNQRLYSVAGSGLTLIEDEPFPGACYGDRPPPSMR